ncbi:MAG: polysaccharide biosynthesis protein CapD [Firmicutes bacterium]|nr:polysaccharide biosynthesis protein CapD [Bacillota bacterium]
MWRKLIVAALFVTDILIFTIVPLLSLYLRLEGHVPAQLYTNMLHALPWFIVIHVLVFYLFGLYHRIWRYAGINDLLAIAGAVLISSILATLASYQLGLNPPRTVYILNVFFTLTFVGSSRLMVRMAGYLRRRLTNGRTRVLIVGAGDAGAMIAREIQQRYQNEKNLIGFIDDDTYKHKRYIMGVRVMGGRVDIGRVVREKGVQEIIVAIPSAGAGLLRNIIRDCNKTRCLVKTVPGIYELLDGKVTVQQLRSIDLEDLLQRDPVELDKTQIATYLSGKRVLVTGAGGSIGSELCRQIAKMKPEKLILLGKGENSIYDIHGELKERFPELSTEPVIADVRDESRIRTIFQQLKPEVVFHAAAHKHVPLMESQPAEAVRNNIFGTGSVAKAADQAGTEVFIMISTDKAVNPTSVMGATKRVSELCIQNLNTQSRTRFAAVRFGNVLGSRGSVVPLFKKQIAKGGPVTITHPDMKRYFMTIPEASQLVLQAGSMAQGGEVFVLDMGEPIKIIDMTRDLITLSGLEPGRDIEIKFTGLRPGEKLFEELLTAEEGTRATKHAKIFMANLKTVNELKLKQGIDILRTTNDDEQILATLKQLVPTYKNEQKEEVAAVNKNSAITNMREKVIPNIHQAPCQAASGAS